MANFEVKGTIVNIGAIEQVSDTFRKRNLVVEIDTETDYPQTVQFEAAQAKCDDGFFSEARKGDEATISFSLRGRVYDNKEKKIKQVFNQLSFWKGQLTKTTASAPPTSQPAYVAPVDVSSAEDDDLPF